MAEDISSLEVFNNPVNSREHKEEEASEIKSPSAIDLVGSLLGLNTTTKEKSKRDFPLCMVLPGFCHEFNADISKILQDKAKKFSEISSNFNKCFKDVSEEAICTNEPTIGNFNYKN